MTTNIPTGAITTSASSGTYLVYPNATTGGTITISSPYSSIMPSNPKKKVAKTWKLDMEAEDRVKLLLKKFKEGVLNEDEFIQILKADKANEEEE